MDRGEKYKLEPILNNVYLFQRLTGFVFHNYQYVGNRLVSQNKRMLFRVALTILTIDLLGHVIGVALELRRGSINELNKTFATFVSILICVVRGMTIVINHDEILEILNELYRLYPHSENLRDRYKLPEAYKSMERRFSFLRKYVTMGVTLFCLFPLINFLLIQKSHESVMRESHILGTWRPYKDNRRFYPYYYVYEVLIVSSGIGLHFTWDTIFAVILHQLCLQYSFVAREIESLNAADTKDPRKMSEFQKQWVENIRFQQHINGLSRKVNEVLNVAILISDLVCAICFCLDIYVILNADNLLTMAVFVVPSTVMIYLTYDISKLGSQLTESSDRISEALYNQNWYEGSIKHQKFTLLWLQLSQNPIKLTAFQLFELNVEHFKETMKFAYQLLTFLQSR